MKKGNTAAMAAREGTILELYKQVVEQREERIKELPNELDLSLTPAALKEAIKEAVKPYDEKLVRYRKEYKKLRKENPRRPDPYGLNATHLSWALGNCVEAMKRITPDQVIKAQELVSEVTGRSLDKLMVKDVDNAAIVTGWLEQFAEANGHLKRIAARSRQMRGENQPISIRT
jgi:hypothetical protein